MTDGRCDGNDASCFPSTIPATAKWRFEFANARMDGSAPVIYAIALLLIGCAHTRRFDWTVAREMLAV